LINEPFGGVRRGGAPSRHNLFHAAQGKPLPDWASECRTLLSTVADAALAGDGALTLRPDEGVILTVD